MEGQLDPLFLWKTHFLHRIRVECTVKSKIQSLDWNNNNNNKDIKPQGEDIPTNYLKIKSRQMSMPPHNPLNPQNDEEFEGEHFFELDELDIDEIDEEQPQQPSNNNNKEKLDSDRNKTCTEKHQDISQQWDRLL